MQQALQESAVAGASQNVTPRIAIVLSSFRGSRDHDGTRVRLIFYTLRSKGRATY